MTANLTVDSWVNPITGVGGSRDKTAAFTFDPFAWRQWDFPVILDGLYNADELAAVKVDAIVDDSFSNGWDIEGSLTPEQKEAVEDFNDRLKIQNEVIDGDKWARLFGGAGVFIGSNDGPQGSPLAGGGEIFFARAYERDELQPSRWYEDIMSPKFGQPSHYRFSPYSSVATGTYDLRSTDIHESRFLLFYGERTTKRRRIDNLGWGSSVLIRPMTALRQFNAAYAVTLGLLADSNQNIYKLKGFADLALSGQNGAIEARIKMIDEFRSAVKALIVDAESEDFVRSQLSLSGVSDVVTQYKERLAAAFEMPLTRLLGVSPAGLNATGESDQRNWNKKVKKHQEVVLRPALERWLNIIFRAKNGPTGGVVPDQWRVKFPSLWEASPKEQAEIDSTNAATDQTYVDMGVLKKHHIAKARFSAESTRPLLTNDDVKDLRQDELLTNIPDTPTDPGYGSDTEDALGEVSPPPVDSDLVRFVDNMNAYSVPSCRHGSTNRCRVCGIERVRDVTMGADGQPVFPVRWRPIGAVKTGDSIDSFNPNQPRDDDGKFGETSAGGASKAAKPTKHELRAQVKDHVSQAHAADRARTAKAHERLPIAKVELAHVNEQVDAIERALGANTVAKRHALEVHEKKAGELTERIANAEAGKPVVSPSDIEVRRDLPAAKKQLEQAKSQAKALSDELGPELPEHAQLRRDMRALHTQAGDIEAEIDAHKQVIKTEAKREKAFGELSAAVEAGDRKAIKRAQAKLTKVLGDSDDGIFENETFNRLHSEESDLGDAFKD